MSRLEARMNKLKSLESDTWYGRLWPRLSETEKMECVDFIERYGELDAAEYSTKIKSKFLNRDRTKNWTLVWELLEITVGVS